MASKRNYEYPYARRDPNVIDDYHGIKVHDYYRHLEEPFSAETLEFIAAQNNLSQSILDNCKIRNRLRKRLETVFDYTYYGIPFRLGDRYFYSMRVPPQNQLVFCTTKSLDFTPEVLVDPNKLAEDGTIAITAAAPSDDGKYLAYALSESGSDWKTIHILEVETRKEFSELLGGVKFSNISWTKDNSGFFYSAYSMNTSAVADGTETNQLVNQKLYYHRIGQAQTEDVLIAEFPENPIWICGGIVSDCGRYLIISIGKGASDSFLYYVDLKDSNEIRETPELFSLTEPEWDCSFSYITNIDRKFFFRTNRNASNFRLVQIDLDNPNEDNWFDVIKENSKAQLIGVARVYNDKLLVLHMRHVQTRLSICSLQTGEFIKEIPIDIGTIDGISASRKYSEIFYSFTSLAIPGIIYRLDLAETNQKSTVFREIKLKGYNQEANKVEQLFYSSADKTKVPLFILQKRDRPKNRRCPCLLYGYGGFGVINPPSFSTVGALFVDCFDGIHVLANIRGGGEYGQHWHDSGRLLNKQNSFDDFQSAAKYLVCKGFTFQRKICILGGSNGGLLVAACTNQKSHLFGAAIAQVGVMDMLRFPKFTIGHAWITEYGDPEKEIDFRYIYKYSPLHNIRMPTSSKEQYPGTLIVTASHDDRVSPLHSYKYVAELQHAVSSSPYQKKPILLRIYEKQGHTAALPVSKKIEFMLDMLVFCYQRLHISQFDVAFKQFYK